MDGEIWMVYITAVQPPVEMEDGWQGLSWGMSWHLFHVGNKVVGSRMAAKVEVRQGWE